MGHNSRSINIFVNEPDIYSGIDFKSYECAGDIFFAGEDEGAFDPSKIDAVLVGLKDVIDDSFLEPFDQVRYIVSNTTGIDHIRTSRKIRVIHLDPKEIQEVSATAEFTLALLLSITRKIPFVDPESVSDRKAYRGTQLKGKKIGIFGMGRLGKRMARYAEALEMPWIAYDRNSTVQDKDRILKTCDVITLHLPMNKQTIDFISQKEFELMKRKPYLINTSRPQLINKAALINALEKSLISGLAMDFINYDGSNRWDEDLRSYRGERLLLTPHVAGNTHESVSYTAQVVVNKFMDMLRKENN
jgi:D-3-phosphoglycerate dehydrogenase